jgi:hypothetical protein
MHAYTQTNAQMFQIIMSGNSTQNDSSNQYLNTATKILDLEKKLAKASRQLVSQIWQLTCCPLPNRNPITDNPDLSSTSCLYCTELL